MNRSAPAMLLVLLLAFLVSSVRGADFPPPPGVVIDHVPAMAGQYVGSPSIAILPDGSYVAFHDLFGPKSAELVRAVGRVFRSTDRGGHWAQVAGLKGAFWCGLFVHRGSVYLMG